MSEGEMVYEVKGEFISNGVLYYASECSMPKYEYQKPAMYSVSINFSDYRPHTYSVIWYAPPITKREE